MSEPFSSIPSDSHTPPTQAPAAGPQCWKCGYGLAGLRIDDVCPECGTPIWAGTTSNSEAERHATQTMVWGVVSLCLTFVCLGPFAGFLTLPSFSAHRRFQTMRAAGGATPSQANTAKAGYICSVITVVISGLMVLLVGGTIAWGAIFG